MTDPWSDGRAILGVYEMTTEPKMSQNATLKEWSPHVELSPKQRKVLHALIEGARVIKAACAGDVVRETVHRWLRTDPAFRAAYNAEVMELQMAVECQLMALAPKAATVV